MPRKKTLAERDAELAKAEEHVKKLRRERDKAAKEELDRMRKETYKALREFMDAQGVQDEKLWSEKLDDLTIRVKQKQAEKKAMAARVASHVPISQLEGELGKCAKCKRTLQNFQTAGNLRIQEFGYSNIKLIQNEGSKA